MKIGFFDSGLGGLTVFNKVIKRISAEYFYLADNKNAPYGIKEKKQVLEYIDKCIKKLVDLKCDIIVIACNSATSIAINELRDKYKNVCIIGTEPAVKVAVDEHYLDKKIFVSATTMTINQQRLNNLIKDLEVEDIVEKIALDKLVEFAEQGIFNGKEVEDYINTKFSCYNLNEFSHLVLGCTHFPLFIDTFKKILPNHIHLVDGSNGILKNINKKINEKHLKESDFLCKLIMTKPSDVFISNFKNISKISDFEVEIM